MRTLKRAQISPGRRAVSCIFLTYSDVVDARRKTLGQYIFAARLAAGYDTQLAFSKAIGVSEASVANAERGGGSVGRRVFAKIEGGLKWAPNTCMGYLETGDESALPGGPSSGMASDPDVERLAQLWTRVAHMSYSETQAMAQYIRRVSGEAAAKRFLLLAFDIQEQARRENTQRDERESVSDHK